MTCARSGSTGCAPRPCSTRRGCPAPEGFDAVEHVSLSLARVPWGFEVEVLLDLPVDRAARRLPPTLAELVEAEDGTLLRMRADSLDWMAGMLASLGCGFTIRTPEELRTSVQQLAERLAASGGPTRVGDVSPASRGGRVRERPHAREGGVGLGICGRGRAGAGAAAAPVDPHRAEAELLRRHVVVEQALRHVEDALARHADRLEGELEPSRARLVAPCRLRRDDPVEGDPEALVRGGEEVGVAVRDHAEPEPLLQAAERFCRVGERGPVADALGERRRGVPRDLEADVRRDAAQPGGEDLAVAPIRRPLRLRLVAAVRLEQRLVLHPGRGRQRAPQRLEEPGLPVDQRPVAVEREDLVAAEVDPASRRQ